MTFVIGVAVFVVIVAALLATMVGSGLRHERNVRRYGDDWQLRRALARIERDHARAQGHDARKAHRRMMDALRNINEER